MDILFILRLQSWITVIISDSFSVIYSFCTHYGNNDFADVHYYIPVSRPEFLVTLFFQAFLSTVDATWLQLLMVYHHVLSLSHAFIELLLSEELSYQPGAMITSSSRLWRNSLRHKFHVKQTPNNNNNKCLHSHCNNQQCILHVLKLYVNETN